MRSCRYNKKLNTLEELACMDVGRVISGSQLLQRATTTEHRDLTPSEKSTHQVEQQQTQNYQFQQVDRVEIESMIEGLNEFLEPVNTSIKFELHDRLEKYYVTVVDSATDEIIREIPPKQMLDIYAAMAEFMGLIVDEKI